MTRPCEPATRFGFVFDRSRTRMTRVWPKTIRSSSSRSSMGLYGHALGTLMLSTRSPRTPFRARRQVRPRKHRPYALQLGFYLLELHSAPQHASVSGDHGI